MKKFIIQSSVIFLAAILPIGGFHIYGATQKDVYGDSFYAELNEKYNRFAETEESNKRIIFIGGSSLSFGLRSDEIEKATGYPVVNFGLYAQLGTRIMSDLALSEIKKDDIVIFAPEISSETYSTEMNYNLALKCFENCKDLRYKLSFDDQTKLFLNGFKYVIEKAKAEVELNEPYTLSSFNEYGDIVSPVVNQNILLSHYDSANMIIPSIDLLTNDFVNYVNSYNNKVSSKGAKMYFSFSPSNDLSLVKDGIDEFEIILREVINCEVLGSVLDYTYDSDYFYDTNYHLNYAGSLKHSAVLASKINTVIENNSTYSIPQMEAPAPMYRVGGEAYSCDYLTLQEVIKGGVSTYTVSGIEESYKATLKNIFIPKSFNNKNIVSISSNSITDLPNLETVVISENVLTLESNVFNNCPKLKKIYLTHTTMSPTVTNGFLNNLSTDCLVYVRSLRMYTAGYNWEIYSNRLASFKIEDIEELMR